MKTLKLAKKLESEVLTTKPHLLAKKYRECCQDIERNHQNFPCLEISFLQKCMAMILLIQAQPSFLFDNL